MTQKEWVEARKTICVDFNGVLDMYQGWKGVDHEYPVRPGAETFLKVLHDTGHTVIIFTAANVTKVKQWLCKNNLDKYVQDVTDKKVPALCYVDDRAVEFTGSFAETLEKIMNFKTHWEDAEHVEGGKV